MTRTNPKASADIVGIGVSVWDTTMVVDQLPTEESVVQAISRHASLGGGVAVAMATASICGANTAMLDRLGVETTSALIRQSLQQHGVDTSWIDIDESASASLATILVKRSTGTRTIVFSPGDDGELQWRPAYAELIANAKIVHLNGRHMEVCRRAIDVAKQNNTLVSYDGGAHRFREAIVPLLPHADILIVAEHFARRHFEHFHGSPADSVSIVELLTCLQRKNGCRLIGVTSGANGSDFVDDQGNVWHQPAMTVSDVIDTTGCGDVFHGAFLAKVAEGNDQQQCSQFAAKIAAENAEGMGALAFGAPTP